ESQKYLLNGNDLYDKDITAEKPGSGEMTDRAPLIRVYSHKKVFAGIYEWTGSYYKIKKNYYEDHK
ncbi:MAG: hypothetical protein J6N76_01950, partial [Lachnospiraceae bacterium]|nr:hypothetical protein [Lachnospiraceae bacterium]